MLIRKIVNVASGIWPGSLCACYNGKIPHVGSSCKHGREEHIEAALKWRHMGTASSRIIGNSTVSLTARLIQLHRKHQSSAFPATFCEEIHAQMASNAENLSIYDAIVVSRSWLAHYIYVSVYLGDMILLVCYHFHMARVIYLQMIYIYIYICVDKLVDPALCETLSWLWSMEFWQRPCTLVTVERYHMHGRAASVGENSISRHHCSDVTWLLKSLAIRLFVQRFVRANLKKTSGGRLNKKDGLTRYGNSHVKDKTS